MAGRTTGKPNVLFILTDDQGYWALGCAGNPEIQTPNLDRLAAEGVRFENFFCTSPVCSPSRASLLTGRIPSQHGVHDWIRSGNGSIKDTDSPIEYLKGYMSYSELLSRNEYECGFSGKWHLGNSAKPQQGFTHWFTYPTGGGSYNDVKMYQDGELTKVPGYITDAITDDALRHIEECAMNSKPFYHSVHYTAPHSPWVDQHPQDIVDSYDDCLFETCPQEPRHPWSMRHPIELQFSESFTGSEKAVPVAIREHLKGYFAAVTAVDLNVGRLIKKLEDLDLLSNTIVFFTSDNGFNCGHHGIWGKGGGTFPQNMYDTSVKVPAIISRPGSIPEGIVSDALVSGYDFMPTLLDYLGIDNPEVDKLPGRSFLPILRGDENAGREHVVIYDEYGPTRMIRTKEWKYIHRYPYGPHELYDLENDPGEKINLLDDERLVSVDQKRKKEIVSTLKRSMEDWFDQYLIPELDGRYQPVASRGQIDLVGPGRTEISSFHERETNAYG